MTFGAASAAATAVGGSAAPRVRGGVWRYGGGALARHRTVYVAKLVALILMYSGAAHLSYWLEFAGPVAAIVWLPVGVGVAFLDLGGLGLFPGVLIGDLLVNDYSALSTLSAVGQSVGNLLEVVVAVVLIRVLVRRGSPLDTIMGAACLLLAIATGTAVSATIGTASLWLGNVLTSDTVASTWRTWWLGDATGALVVVPLAIAWQKLPRPVMHARRAVEAIVLFAAIAVVSDLSSGSDQPVVYVVFPLRRGLRCASVAGVRRWLPRSRSASRSGTQPTIWGPLPTRRSAAAWPASSCSSVSQPSRPSFSRPSCRNVTSSPASWRPVAAVSSRAGQRERRRLEQNLHDGAQHRLVWLAADLGRAAGVVREHPSQAPGLFAQAEHELMAVLDELRDLAHGIHPTVLTELGLSGAIRAMARRSSCPRTVGDLPAERLDLPTETTAYYVVAEAAANAQKHAGASRIHVSAVADDRRSLRVDVTDDGVGGAIERGSGLQGLRDRVEGVGGSVRVHTPPGLGTHITATIPLTGARRRRAGISEPEPEGLATTRRSSTRNSA